MRCKKVLIFALMLLFLAVQAVPLAAWDRLQGGTDSFSAEENADDDGGGGGEEHPWQDDDGDDDDAISGFSKGIKALISLFFGKKDIEKKPAPKKEKVKKDHSSKKSSSLFRKYK